MHLHVVCSSSGYNWGNAKFLAKNKSWEFAHRFFEQIAHFLGAKERKSDLLGKRANCSHCSFVKSDGNNLLFGITKRKSWENCQKHKNFCWANRSFFSSKERFACEIEKNHSRCSLVKWDKSDLITVALFKEPREQITHCCSLKWAILSKRAKNKEGKCEEPRSKFPTLSKTNVRYPFKGPYLQKNTVYTNITHTKTWLLWAGTNREE